MARGQKKLILGHGTRFNIAERAPLKDGSCLWAVWDNETQGFIKNGPTCLEFWRYEDAADVRNRLELRRLTKADM